MKDEKNENKGKFNREEFGKRLREVRKKSKVTSDRLDLPVESILFLFGKLRQEQGCLVYLYL